MDSEQPPSDPSPDNRSIPNEHPDMNSESGNDRSDRFSYRNNNAMIIAAESLSAETLNSTTGSDWSSREAEEGWSDELESVSSGIPLDWFSGDLILDMRISVRASTSDASANVATDSEEHGSLNDGQAVAPSEESVASVTPSDPASESVASDRSAIPQAQRMEPVSNNTSVISLCSSGSSEMVRRRKDRMDSDHDTLDEEPALHDPVIGPNGDVEPFDNGTSQRNGSSLPTSSEPSDSAQFIGPSIPVSNVEPSPTIGPSLPTKIIGPSIPTSGNETSHHPLTDALPMSETQSSFSVSASEPFPSPIGPSLPTTDSGPMLPPTAVETSHPHQPIGPLLPTTIGPSLPPSIGPSLPPTIGPSIGPSLPPTIGPSLPHSIGPCLPPNVGPSFPPQNVGPVPPRREIGPALPPGFAIGDSGNENDIEEEEEECFGPMPPKEDESMETDEPVGPMPISNEAAEAAAEEYALLRMRMEKKEDSNKPKREDWMLKVPDKVANIGLGARQFKRGSSATAELDKTWEDCPQAKRPCGREDGAGMGRSFADAARDEEQNRLAEAYNKGRDESLVDAHLKAEKNAKPQNPTDAGERVPFDREKDMGGGGKKMSLEEVRERAGNLSSRFASGTSQKFL